MYVAGIARHHIFLSTPLLSFAQTTSRHSTVSLFCKAHGRKALVRELISMKAMSRAEVFLHVLKWNNTIVQTKPQPCIKPGCHYLSWLIASLAAYQNVPPVPTGPEHSWGLPLYFGTINRTQSRRKCWEGGPYCISQKGACENTLSQRTGPLLDFPPRKSDSARGGTSVKTACTLTCQWTTPSCCP